MSQKIIMATLTMLIVGVIGYGVYSAQVEDTPATLQTTNQPVQATPVQQNTALPAASAETTQEPQVMAQNTVGDVWQSDGTIVAIDDFGFTLELPDASTTFVELGPPDYWQAQGVALTVGDSVQVIGWNNGEQTHARVVITNQGELTLRSETSQPLWSGGASSGQGQNGTHDTAAGGQVQFQVAPEDWVTVAGVLTKVSNGTVTMQTVDGEVYALQMGQPNFWQSQGVILNIDDAVEVLGFWMNGQFSVGDITKTATGEHIILRDPNGRQLWGGPGRNGNANNQTSQSGQ